MTQRYRLFVSVFIAFAFIFIGTFTCQMWIEREGLSYIRSDFARFYADLKEDRRVYAQHMIKEAIARRIVQVDASLAFIQSEPAITSLYAPNNSNIDMGTWHQAAELIENRSHLSFIQNSYNGKILSLITPLRSGMHPIYIVQKDDPDFLWASVEQKADGQKDPLSLGVLFSNNTYILYDVESLIRLPIADLQKKIGSIERIDTPFIMFIDRLLRVQSLIKKGVDRPVVEPQLQAVTTANPPRLCAGSVTACIQDAEEYERQLFMIKQLSFLLQAAFVREGALIPDMPLGIAFFSAGTSLGSGFFTTEVFSSKQAVAPENYLSSDQDSVAIFFDKERGTTYLGNMIALDFLEEEQERKGHLVLGFDAAALLEDMALALNEMTWMVHEDRLILQVSASGKQTEPSVISSDTLRPLLNTPEGIVCIEDKEYYYVHVQPFARDDLHLYMLRPAAIEFSHVNQLKESVQKILNKSSRTRDGILFLGMLIIIIILLNLTKQITRPIVAMAKAARLVEADRLDAIELPILSLGAKNEVQILRDSFATMIQGLKEKEKVKGILNKVVSQDIAKEILKGDIHLGGEEKVVTMLFADIRHFTNQTQNMEPKQVIKLLNTCMTRLDTVIEAHQGVIDKYVGDEIMVLFGAPIARENSALDAIKCALEIMQVLDKWNIERAEQQLLPVQMGVGIHTGKVLAGNMGAESRLNYTVIGKNVNLASRICSAAGGGEIYISQDTLLDPHVVNKINVEDLGQQHLKGFDQGIPIYKVIGIK